MTKVCPDCAESVQDDARVCHFCGFRFAPPIDSPSQRGLKREPSQGTGIEPTRSGDSPLQQSKQVPAPRPPAGEKRRKHIALAVLAALAFLLAIAGGAAALVLNGQDHPKSGEYLDAVLDPSLPAGGLPSTALPISVAEKSLQNSGSVGYQIVVEAEKRGVINDFRAVSPSGPWSTQFRLDNGDLTMRFKSGDKGYLLRYPTPRSADAQKIRLIAGEYGFYTVSMAGVERNGEIEALEEQLIELVRNTELTEGIAAPEIDELASTVSAHWLEWLAEYEGEDREVDAVVRADLTVAEAAQTLASYPTQEKLDAYNAAVDELNRAIKAFNNALEEAKER